VIVALSARLSSAPVNSSNFFWHTGEIQAPSRWSSGCLAPVSEAGNVPTAYVSAVCRVSQLTTGLALLGCARSLGPNDRQLSATGGVVLSLPVAPTWQPANARAAKGSAANHRLRVKLGTALATGSISSWVPRPVMTGQELNVVAPSSPIHSHS
jgi:hypothetical protein